MDTVQFSVIIPTYNRAHLILKTLNSILDQSFKDFEIIIVDDHSSDNTKEILSPFFNSNKIRFIQHEKNYERAQARNTGIEKARGEYITFMDSDDLMHKDNLLDAHSFIAANPETLFFHNLYNLISSEGKIIYTPLFPQTGNLGKAISTGNFLSCVGVFINKEIYQKLKFDTNPVLTGSEDHEYWLRVIAHYPQLGRINKFNNSMVSHNERSVNINDVDNIRQRYRYIVNKIKGDRLLHLFYKRYLSRIESTAILYMAAVSNMQGRYRIAFFYCFEAFKKDNSIILTLHFWRSLQIAFFRIKIKTH